MVDVSLGELVNFLEALVEKYCECGLPVKLCVRACVCVCVCVCVCACMRVHVFLVWNINCGVLISGSAQVSSSLELSVEGPTIYMITMLLGK